MIIKKKEEIVDNQFDLSQLVYNNSCGSLDFGKTIVRVARMGSF